MKNADKPAMPQPFAGDALHGMNTSAEKDPSNAGMTKREAFALAAMQGILAGRNTMNDSPEDWVAQWAVRQGDALLKALEETKP